MLLHICHYVTYAGMVTLTYHNESSMSGHLNSLDAKKLNYTGSLQFM